MAEAAAGVRKKMHRFGASFSFFCGKGLTYHAMRGSI
nr:MAG TPA: hypothetical protein [Caudoviricetes sp.]